MSIGFLQYALSMAAYFLLLMVIIESMRNHYRFANVFWMASLLTFPLWLMGGVVGWFRWAKILSVILPTIFVGFTRVAHVENKKGKLWDMCRKPAAIWFLYGILFLNIMEATVKDFSTGHLFNAMCGFLLCVTIPFPMKFWKIDTAGKGELLAYTTAFWNFAYTTWNMCFVYGESPQYFAASVCILLAAEIYPLIKGRPELYITARIYTLAAHLLIRACVPWLFPTLMDATPWQNQNVLVYWGIVNFVIIVPYVFWHMWQLQTGNAATSFMRQKKNTKLAA